MIDDTQQSALMQLQQHLLAAKMDEESVAYILGKLTAFILTQATEEVGRLFSQEELQNLEQLSDEDRQEQLEQLFLEKKGISLSQYREDLAEKLLAEFETA